MMQFKAICPKTQKLETIYYDTINCPTQDNPNNYILGLMNSCTAIGIGEELCNECPINQVIRNTTIQN